MAFEVFNHGSTLYPDQTEVDRGLFQVLAQAIRGTGVKTGCLVSAQGAPDGTSLLTSGTYRVTGSDKTCAGGNVSVLTGSANSDGSTALAADANWPRYDLIVLNKSAQFGVIHGATDPVTYADDRMSNPVWPAWDTATQCVIGAWLIPPGTTSLVAGLLQRLDVLISVNAFYDMIHTMSGGSHTGEIANAQHGIRSVASAHDFSHLTGSVSNAQAMYLIPVTFSRPGTLAVTTESTAPPDSALPWRNDSGRTLTLIAARANLKTVNTGADAIFDLNLDGTTMMTGTKIVIAASASPATTKQTTFSTTAVPDGSYLSINIDQIGSTVAGAGLTLTAWLRG